MSIYDFLPEEKSQEVQPSESVPQVDEAQVVLNSFDEDGDYKKYPSSALDTCPTCSYPMHFPSYRFCTNVNCEYLKPAEDTDKTLFSVGDVLTVKSPDEVYSMDTHPEDYYHLQEHQGKKVVITSRRKAYRGVFYGTSIEENGKVPFFYHRELKI